MEILATYRVLQYHTTVASKHLMREINSLTRMDGAEADKMSISSYKSSRSLFRSLFGNGSARNEVGKLLARLEYFNKMPEDLTEIAAYLHDRAYKDRPKPKEFSVHRSRVLQDNDEAKSTASRNSTTPMTGPPLARNHTASEGQSIQFATEPPIPNSISMLLSRRHAVTQLPGAGMIGVSTVGAPSEKTTTSNNGPETIASGLNNDEQRVPASARARIPSPKLWTIYVFQNRVNQEPTGPS